MSSIPQTEKEWSEKLTESQYNVLRQKGTEPAFSGELLESKETGMYICAGCNAELFSSESKFDSKSGWPSFWKSVGDDSVELRTDSTHGMNRVEVVCAKCEGHLGHVFNDGPQPSGKHFCINSTSLGFKKEA